METQNSTHKAIIAVLGIMLITGVYVIILQNSKIKDLTIQNTPTTEDTLSMVNTTPLDIPLETGSSFGKELKDFLSSFPSSEDIGSPRSLQVHPEAQLVLITYPTSQESRTFGVVDYGNNVFHRDIYSDGLGGGIAPQGFIGTDKLLLTSLSDSDGITRISIGNFRGEVLKELSELAPGQLIHETYTVGDEIHITIYDGTTYENHTIDPETLLYR
ncbi:MAG: hypothetical protein ACI83D_000503 [Planctomycetota bacterium]|jgi:hypothetical protein